MTTDSLQDLFENMGGTIEDMDETYEGRLAGVDVMKRRHIAAWNRLHAQLVTLGSRSCETQDEARDMLAGLRDFMRLRRLRDVKTPGVKIVVVSAMRRFAKQNSLAFSQYDQSALQASEASTLDSHNF